MDKLLIEKFVFWAGIGHFALCAGSLFVPVALGWRRSLEGLQPLLRQMFWTYAAYILAINLAFGALSVAAADELLSGTILAKGITLFIALYWLTRVGIQFFYFDRSHAPKGFIYTVGEISLVSSFIAFSFVYLIAFLSNCAWF